MKSFGIEFSLGFMKPTAVLPFGGPRSFGSPGAGGAMGFADPDTGIGYAYVTSGMGTRLAELKLGAAKMAADLTSRRPRPSRRVPAWTPDDGGIHETPSGGSAGGSFAQPRQRECRHRQHGVTHSHVEEVSRRDEVGCE